MASENRFAGIDIGSRSIECVVVEDGRVVDSRMTPSGFDPLESAQKILNEVSFTKLIATGYGRHLLEISRDIETVTEIKAYAEGACHVLPGVRTILDIGGQDVKAISVGSNGKVQKFEMNDRCAAGSGKFLEIMANTLGYKLEEFGQNAKSSQIEITISSMCTVFAESEVTSLLNKGAGRADVAMAVHRSIVKRAVSMLNRVTITEPLLFAGGGALNPCVRELLEETLNLKVHVPADPHTVGALGAALIAERRFIEAFAAANTTA